MVIKTRNKFEADKVPSTVQSETPLEYTRTNSSSSSSSQPSKMSSDKVIDGFADNAVKKIIMVSKLVKTKDQLKQYITYLKNIILLLKKCIINRLQCVGNFSKIESNLAVLKVYLSKFKRKLSKRKFSHRYVQWEEVESCFNKRIKSGVIANINVKDPIIFLRKAFRSFRVHIRKQLKNSVIKVNVVFVGVFIKPQNAETSIKHFVTKSEITDNNTNLKEWYKEHVNDKMLAKFEEFQEKDMVGPY
nr:unnamed protein product [Callosobruchus analis]